MPATTDKKTNTNDRNQFFGEAAELARTPLLAAIGAGDLAARAVVESLTKLREQVNERTEAARTDLPRDFGQLRERLDPAELRKRVDSYAESARQLIDYLAGRGEETLQRLQSQPQVKKVWEQVESAQDRLEETVSDARGIADDVLGKVSRQFGAKGEDGAEAGGPEAAGTGAAKTASASGAERSSAARTTKSGKNGTKPGARSKSGEN